MDISSHLKDKKAIFVELDDVLFPKKDYDLQVYYLFAQFLEMAGEHGAPEIVEFVKENDNSELGENVFNRLATKFEFVSKYRSNFDRLYKTAKLPLKLFMYQKVYDFLNLGIQNGAQIFIVTGGDPETQLNKIKNLNWLGLENYIKVFFLEELEKPFLTVVANLLNDNNLLAPQGLIISKNKLDFSSSNYLDLPYVFVTEINDN